MKDLRRKRLAELLNGPRFNGDRAALYQAAGITKGRLTQLLDAKEPFGDVAANNLCESLNLPKGWFDSATATITEHAQASSTQDATITRGPIERQTSSNSSLSHTLASLAHHLEQADPAMREPAAGLLAAIAKTPDNPALLASLEALLTPAAFTKSQKFAT